LRYGPVPSGGNLYGVARRLAPSGASIPQTALALFRANPQAFGGGDINNLKAGARLEIPYPDLVFGVDAETAKRQFQGAQHGEPLPLLLPVPPSAEALDRDRLEIASRAMLAEAQAGAGVAAPPSPPAAPEASSSIPDPDPALARVEREILLVREMAESGRQETGELGERVGLLERQLEDIKRLLELSNAQLAQLQGLTPEVEIPGSGTPEGESPELEYPGTKPLEGETPAAEASVAAELAPAPKTPAATLVPTPMPAPDPSFFDDPSLSSWALVVGGPLLILLLGLLLLVRRQNRAKEAAWTAEGALGETLAVMAAAPAVTDIEPVIPALIPKALEPAVAPAPGPAIHATPAGPAEEPRELDLSDLAGWNLGGDLALDPVTGTPPIETPSAAPFPAQTPYPKTPPTEILVIDPQTPSPEPKPALDLAAGDFDLDLDSLGKLGPASGATGRDKSEEPLPDLDLDLDDLMDLDLSAFESADKTPEQARKALKSEPDLGWGALGLSLETEDNLSKACLADESPPDTGFPADFQMESGPWDEVGIKLDLARAYLRMDDPEAARTLLDEAIAEGNQEQIAEAKAMLARLE